MSAPDLSIVIPAYNEAARLLPTLAAIRQHARERAGTCELIVVDDGSTDTTAACVRGFDAGALAVRLLANDVNRGKGHAVRQGVLVASGRQILVSDADLSAPMEELEKLRVWLERGFDVAIGSRDLPESRLDPPQPLGRRLAAWTFRAVRRRVLLRELRDTQCGFKLFSAAAAREVFSRATVDGWLFDCEVLGLAERLGFRIKEVGIVWRNHPDSRVRAVNVALRALPELLAIRRKLKEVARSGNREVAGPNS